jgi:hypothetical protein
MSFSDLLFCWLTRIVTKNAAGAVLIGNSYARDDAGRIKVIDGLLAADDWTYTYDDLDRLTSATNASDASLSETTGPRRASRAFVR